MADFDGPPVAGDDAAEARGHLEALLGGSPFDGDDAFEARRAVVHAIALRRDYAPLRRALHRLCFRPELLTLLMGRHPRLGRDSPLRRLPAELLLAVASFLPGFLHRLLYDKPRGSGHAARSLFDDLVELRWDLETLQLVVEAGAGVCGPNAQGDAPVFMLFRRARAVPGLSPRDVRTWLHWILASGADINERSRAGRTVLMEAIAPHDHFLSFLLDRGADPSLPDDRGLTPLHHAVSLPNQQQAVRLLVGAGADVNAADADGQTPLMRIMLGFGRTGRPDFDDVRGRKYGALMLRALLLPGPPGSAGIDLERRDARGRTALFVAAEEGRIDFVEALHARAQVDLEAADENGLTPLGVALARRHVRVSRFLEQQTATVGATAASPIPYGGHGLSAVLAARRYRGAAGRVA